MKITRVSTKAASMFLASVMALATGGAGAQAAKEYRVVGTWSGLSMFEKYEKPFWEKDLPGATNGAMKGLITPQTELGLKGFEIVRLIKAGVFDFGHGVTGYVAEDPVVEAVDLSGIAQDFDTARKIIAAYRSTLDETMEKRYGVKLLAVWPLTSQTFFCRDKITRIEDLKGKKIRVYSASMADFVQGIGGTGVTVAFAETMPSIQKGVVDCGVTGVMPAYDSKWWQVTGNLYALRIGWGVNFLAANPRTLSQMTPAQRDALMAQVKAFETKILDAMSREDAGAIACLTNTARCEYGAPGTMTLVNPSPADIAKRNAVLENSVLKSWAKRCGAECVNTWNARVSNIVGVKAPVP